MSTVRVNLKDFAKSLGDLTHATLAEQKRAVARGIARSIPDLVAASPVDTGLYAQSWDFRIDEEKAVIGNYAPYSGIIEFGARPFTPPIAPLLAWAKRVLNSGSQPPEYDSDVWALAKYTQKKISERGMQPRHVMENAIPTIIENIRLEFTRER